jgi:hypothetical protein
MGLASDNTSGDQDFEVAPKFLENCSFLLLEVRLHTASKGRIIMKNNEHGRKRSWSLLTHCVILAFDCNVGKQRNTSLRWPVFGPEI